MNKLLTLIILMLLSFNLLGATRTGNDVMHNCSMVIDTSKINNESDIAAASECAGYLNGINDTHILFQTILETQFYCLPENGIETGQLIRVSIKWLEANPETLHETFRSVFVAVMKDAFPCSPPAQ
jgi:hypothetical protein